MLRRGFHAEILEFREERKAQPSPVEILSMLSVEMGDRNPKYTDSYRAAASLALNVGKEQVWAAVWNL